MEQPLNESTLTIALDWLYDKAINGLPGLKTADEVAAEYQQRDGTLAEKIDALIRWHVAKASASGFLTGLGGILTLPVTLPANLSSVFYIQLQMVAAIGYMAGLDLRDQRVKALCLSCLLGGASKKELKKLGVRVEQRLVQYTLTEVSSETLQRIQRTVVVRLLAKLGQSGAVSVGKLIPILGGVVGGTFDAMTTHAVGKAAKETFID